jgi:hypothetical protein
MARGISWGLGRKGLFVCLCHGQIASAVETAAAVSFIYIWTGWELLDDIGRNKISADKVYVCKVCGPLLRLPYLSLYRVRQTRG